jgi:hypothetical protein
MCLNKNGADLLGLSCWANGEADLVEFDRFIDISVESNGPTPCVDRMAQTVAGHEGPNGQSLITTVTPGWRSYSLDRALSSWLYH